MTSLAVRSIITKGFYGGKAVQGLITDWPFTVFTEMGITPTPTVTPTMSVTPSITPSMMPSPTPSPLPISRGGGGSLPPNYVPPPVIARNFSSKLFNVNASERTITFMHNGEKKIISINYNKLQLKDCVIKNNDIDYIKLINPTINNKEIKIELTLDTDDE